ncbi:type VI secretion system baseplate subunit TssG [Caballeronia sp. BR00000012568055]|uniref:type VI secretion system baseplate subunit TssG n=1 Tax=Caballeronia sp. BR00000012568055 TaxID=2918761 RepID=UPI0023F8AEF0|nr:type VI secretion system baseplate subunit TssG [Caballeronia sp. BR00000012568055]
MTRSNSASSEAGTGLSSDMLEHLRAEPWRYGFLSLMRRIGARPELDPVGTAMRPSAEPFRIGQKPSLIFAPSEVASAEEAEGRLRIRLLGLGMLGPNGSLPIHVTEIAREREESRNDSTLVDFLDVFHHRYLTLFYRAWANAQSAAGLDRAGAQNEPFSFHVGCLAGIDAAEAREREVPAHARLSASAHLVRETRDPDGLRMTLAHYFGVPVSIEEHVFHWIDIADADRARLGLPGEASTMSEGAILGERVPDCQYRFRIVIGPVSLDDYLRFTPQGEDLPHLVGWVRSFVDQEFNWELDVRIRTEDAPPMKISGPQQVGWSGWLGRSPDRDAVTGMRFDPEAYMNDLDAPASSGPSEQWERDSF